MKIGGCDIITCGDMKCRNHDCDKRLYLAENELGCYVAIPGLDCPEKALDEARKEDRSDA